MAQPSDQEEFLKSAEAFGRGYSRAFWDFDGPPDSLKEIINPFQEGTDEYHGWEEGAYDATNK